jgi:hypothetical protein
MPCTLKVAYKNKFQSMIFSRSYQYCTALCLEKNYKTDMYNKYFIQLNMSLWGVHQIYECVQFE